MCRFLSLGELDVLDFQGVVGCFVSYECHTLTIG
jgi:hypothetical protein